MVTGTVVEAVLDITTTVDEGATVVEGAADELDVEVVVVLGVVESVGEVDGVRVGVVEEPSVVDTAVVDVAAVLADAPVPKGTVVDFSVGSFLSVTTASVNESTASSVRSR